MKARLKSLALAAALALGLSATQGCGGVDMFTAKTTAYYKLNADGSKEISYTSGKDQQGLAVSLEEDKAGIKKLAINVDKASTPEAAIAAALQIQAKILDQLTALVQQAQALSAGS